MDPLSNGATVYMYEGAPDYPEPDRFWRIIEENSITIFYTAPTAIRAFMKWGDEWIEKHDLSSLRLLGSVGEPINPDVWLWYFENIGKSKCPIVDTWWQTETGSIMISPLPGASDLKPGSAGIPFFGIDIDIVNDSGDRVEPNIIGNLIVRKPWPSMARGLWASAERFRKVYWSDFPGYYFTGDSARKDIDGFFWISGRADDVIVVSGHNIGTAEVESALLHHHAVAEAAVVGRPDDNKTSVIVAFVTLKDGISPGEILSKEINTKVANALGHIAKPEEIRFVQQLPKTRSGKIMRRFLKQIAGRNRSNWRHNDIRGLLYIGKTKVSF
jgi:acetyl-CoA synthetase